MVTRRANAGTVSAAAVLLALASATAWGVADFSGGLVSRSRADVPVTVISQAAGFVALLVAVGIADDGIDHRSFGIGILAGLGGGAGLAAFYKALSLGTMSIVSPVTACGAVVPFTISIATGERPGTVAVVGRCARDRRGGARLGRGAALGGSRPRARDHARASSPPSRSGSSPTSSGSEAAKGSALSTLAGARVGSLGLLLAARARPARVAARRAEVAAADRRASASATSPRTRSSPSRAATGCCRSSRCSAPSTRSRRCSSPMRCSASG